MPYKTQNQQQTCQEECIQQTCVKHNLCLHKAPTTKPGQTSKRNAWFHVCS